MSRFPTEAKGIGVGRSSAKVTECLRRKHLQRGVLGVRCCQGIRRAGARGGSGRSYRAGESDGSPRGSGEGNRRGTAVIFRRWRRGRGHLRPLSAILTDRRSLFVSPQGPLTGGESSSPIRKSECAQSGAGSPSGGANTPRPRHGLGVNTVVHLDASNRIILSRELRRAAGIPRGQTLKASATPGRIVLEIPAHPSGRVVKRGKLKVWTGLVPTTPIAEAIEGARHYER